MVQTGPYLRFLSFSPFGYQSLTLPTTTTLTLLLSKCWKGHEIMELLLSFMFRKWKGNIKIYCVNHDNNLSEVYTRCCFYWKIYFSPVKTKGARTPSYERLLKSIYSMYKKCFQLYFLFWGGVVSNPPKYN